MQKHVLIEYVRVGPRFSNTVLQALMVLVKKLPPKSDGCKLLVVATSSDSSILEDLQLSQAFNIVLSVPEVTSPNQVKKGKKAK